MPLGVKGLIPAAGLGTRLLPATKAQPKEMLPIVDKPTIQYVVEEAAAAGLTEVVIVVGPAKRSIEEHFSGDPKALARFDRAGKLPALAETLALIRKIPIRFVTQEEPRGLGDAVYQARHILADEPFAVLLGDDILLAEKPATAQLAEHADAEHPSIVGVQPLPSEELGRYGVVEPEPGEGRLRRLRGLVEKPPAGKAPSNLAVVGRYVLSPRIFDCIKRTPPGRGDEVQLTDALRLLLKESPVYSLELQATRLDVGGRLEWLKANLEIAFRDPTLGPALRTHLKRI